MKKVFALIMVVSFMLLTACGAGNEPQSVSEVIEQAIQANENLDSYSADMKLDTELMGMQVTIEGKSDITHDPDTLYMEMTMGMTGITMDVEAYVVGEEMYMGMFGEWFIVDEEELGLDSFDQLNKEELEKLNGFADQFEMTEEDNMYVLTLSGEGEEFNELIEPYLDYSMGDLAMEPALEEDSSDLLVNSLEMEIRIDKESMIIHSQTVHSDIEMDGELYQVNAESTISNMNEIEPVELPDEVRENAVSEDFIEEDFEYEEESMTLEEIQEAVDYTVPQVSNVPDGYEITDSYYDEYLDMAYFIYEKDFENGFILSVYPSVEEYGEIFMDETTETVTINGNEGVLEIIEENFLFLTWEHNDVFLELMGEGSEMSKEILLQIAESVE